MVSNAWRAPGRRASRANIPPSATPRSSQLAYTGPACAPRPAHAGAPPPAGAQPSNFIGPTRLHGRLVSGSRPAELVGCPSGASAGGASALSWGRAPIPPGLRSASAIPRGSALTLPRVHGPRGPILPAWVGGGGRCGHSGAWCRASVNARSPAHTLRPPRRARRAGGQRQVQRQGGCAARTGAMRGKGEEQKPYEEGKGRSWSPETKASTKATRRAATDSNV